MVWNNSHLVQKWQCRQSYKKKNLMLDKFLNNHLLNKTLGRKWSKHFFSWFCHLFAWSDYIRIFFPNFNFPLAAILNDIKLEPTWNSWVQLTVINWLLLFTILVKQRNENKNRQNVSTGIKPSKISKLSLKCQYYTAYRSSNLGIHFETFTIYILIIIRYFSYSLFFPCILLLQDLIY